MSSDELSDSGSEYQPGTSDREESDMSGESEVYDDSDEELCANGESIVEEGWRFMADPFSDSRPDPLPPFDDAATGISTHVEQFTCPREAFSFFL